MAITDIGSYVTTGSEFESHWTDVDADRIANSLAVFALPDGFVLADLSTAVAAVAAAITSQESLDNALSIATSGRDAQKAALRDRVIEFHKIDSLWQPQKQISNNHPQMLTFLPDRLPPD